MGDIGGIAQAGASVADTAMSDATNYAIAQQQMNFNASQAQANREFQMRAMTGAQKFDWSSMRAGQQFAASEQLGAENFSAREQLQSEQYNTRMSDTAIQRRAADLKAAGFNPMLGLTTLGGASSPVMGAPSSPVMGSGIAASPMAPGSMASSPGLPSMAPITGGLQGVLTAQKQRDLLSSQQAGVDLDNRRKAAELPYAASQAGAVYQRTVAESNQLMGQIRTLSSQFNVNEANAAKVSQDKDFAAQLQPILVEYNRLQNQRWQYQMPELALQSDFFRTDPLAKAIVAGQQGGKVGDGVGTTLAILRGLQRVPTGAIAHAAGDYATAVGENLGAAE